MTRSFLHVIIFLSLISLNLWAKIPQSSQESYTKALKAYDANDFNTAFSLLEPIIAITSDDTEVNFYFGRCALELKRYSDAEASFDRVLIMEPKHTRSKLELSRLYVETEQFELAGRFLDEALQEPIPLHVKQNLEQLKTMVDAKQSRHTFMASLSLGVDYDTNIANDVGYGVSLFGEAQRKSPALFQTLLLGHTYDMAERGGLMWESLFMAYNKNLTRYSDKDLLLGSFTSGPTYSFDTHKLSIQGLYERVSLGSEDYLGAHGVSLNVKELLSPSWMLEADITRRIHRYVDKKATDTKATAYTLGSKYAFVKNDWIVSTYFTYNQERENDALISLSLNEKRFSLDITKTLTSDLRATLGYTYRDLDYQQSQRQDYEHSYTLGFYYDINKFSALALQHRYNNHPSNEDLYDYSKHVTSLSYVRNF